MQKNNDAKAHFHGILLGTLGASILEILLTAKGVKRSNIF